MRGGCYIYLYLEFDLRKENEMISAQHAGKWQRWVHVYKIEHDGIMFIIDI